MSKLIAVTGSPGSGKSVTACKLAKFLYQKDRQPVILLSPDIQVPLLPCIFPSKASQDLFSMGSVLEQTEITQSDIVKALVTLKGMKNLGVLGYKAGENRYSYPQPTPDKIQQLIAGLKHLAEYVVVDCTNHFEDDITRACLAQASTVVQLIVPDVKSLSYYLSQEPDFPQNTVQVFNHTGRDIPAATQEVAEFFKGVKITLPYSRDLKFQAMSGLLMEQNVGKKYYTALVGLAQAVIK